jgi:hypothetical protein
LASDVKSRSAWPGEPALAIESKLAVSARYVFDGSF